jgi:enterochelin esterase family protein
MGAGQAMQIGLTHLDMFSAIGAFSGGGKADPKTAFGGVFADPVAFDKKVSLLYLHAGTASGDAGPLKSAESLYQALQQAGIKNVVLRDAKGLAHEWHTWRYALYDFAPRLFQQPAVKLEPQPPVKAPPQKQQPSGKDDSRPAATNPLSPGCKNETACCRFAGNPALSAVCAVPMDSMNFHGLRRFLLQICYK